MKIKNIIIRAIIIAVIAILSCCNSAYALELTASKTKSLKKGDVIDVTVCYGENKDVSEITGQLEYDENLFELVEDEDGVKYKVADGCEHIKMTEANKFNIFGFSKDDNNIITFSFRVKENTKFDSSDIKVTNLTTLDDSLNPIDDNAEISVTITNKKSNSMPIILGVIFVIIILAVVIIVVVRKRKSK